MELRDWFAGQALIGLLVANTEHRHDMQDTAYEIAERMLDVRRSARRRVRLASDVKGKQERLGEYDQRPMFRTGRPPS